MKSSPCLLVDLILPVYIAFNILYVYEKKYLKPAIY